MRAVCAVRERSACCAEQHDARLLLRATFFSACAIGLLSPLFEVERASPRSVFAPATPFCLLICVMNIVTKCAFSCRRYARYAAVDAALSRKRPPEVPLPEVYAAAEFDACAHRVRYCGRIAFPRAAAMIIHPRNVV